MLSHMCVAHATSTPVRKLCPYQIGATKNISPLPTALFPTQPSIQVSIVTTTFLLLSTPTSDSLMLSR